MKSILLVDDSSLFYSFMRDVLKKDNVEIVWAKNGKEALKKFKEKNPNLVIVDIILSDMNGVELIRKLKEINKEAKVIVITGLDKDYVAEDAFEAGAEDYIVKNIPIKEFRDKIIHYLQD
ncbi:MAG TPA: response regulator [Candidatus Aciduliprofundum boonei]|uniref:Response regulator n=1 Tax=Candidatus Aciduliprofundum boonei TaxID=379547 RepID=A0A7J3T8V2_9ARCH|nr:response regulator [Candidatus Aciduliprofundum boonei]